MLVFNQLFFPTLPPPPTTMSDPTTATQSDLRPITHREIDFLLARQGIHPNDQGGSVATTRLQIWKWQISSAYFHDGYRAMINRWPQPGEWAKVKRIVTECGLPCVFRRPQYSAEVVIHDRSAELRKLLCVSIDHLHVYRPDSSPPLDREQVIREELYGLAETNINLQALREFGFDPLGSYESYRP